MYRFDPQTGELSIVVDDMDKPNGLAFSPDEMILYVADSGLSHNPNGNHHIRAYDVVNGKSVNNGRVFAVIDPGVPDGFRLDIHGYLFTSSADSIQVYDPNGQLLGKIMVPEVISQLYFRRPTEKPVIYCRDQFDLCDYLEYARNPKTLKKRCLVFMPPG